MNAKLSVFVIGVEVIIYLLLYNLHDCTFKCANPKIQHFSERGHTNREIFIGYNKHSLRQLQYQDSNLTIVTIKI